MKHKLHKRIVRQECKKIAQEIYQKWKREILKQKKYGENKPIQEVEENTERIKKVEKCKANRTQKATQWEKLLH